MAGYREFQTGEVLTAANVNSFLMEQATMTFADAAARDAALAGVLRAGLNVYLQDTDRLQYYDGTDWQNVPNESDVDAAGGLVAVKSAIFTGTQTNSTASGANFAVTDLTITHETADPANKLILVAQLSQVGSSIGIGFVGAAFHDGTDLINVGAAAGARIRTGVGYSSPTASSFETKSLALYNVYTPGEGSKTYTVRVINLRTDGTRTLYVNRTERDGSDDGRGASTFTLMEVKV